MYNITLWPLGTVLQTDGTVSLLKLLQGSGVYIKSLCGGNAVCACCVIKILSGEHNLSPMDYKELKHLGNTFHLTKERLACQTYPTGDITIDVSMHIRTKDQEALDKKSGAFFSQVKQSTKLKKKTEIPVDQEQEKAVDNSKEQVREEPKWFKHWEKKDQEVDNNIKRVKKLGGNKRPKRKI